MYMSCSGKRIHVVKGEEEEETEIEHLSQQNVDRFGILLDLWTCEARYQEAKMKVSQLYHCIKE